MTARAGAGAIAFGFIATVVIGAGGAGAGAAAPDDQGWWTAANGGVAPAPASPDVPSDGLLVQGGPAGSPVAYAALRYALPSGTAARSLTLSVAPNSASTPLATLEVCPLRQPEFQPAQGGAMNAAPAYTCATKVTAAPGSNGTDYRFDLAGLNASGTVAIAIVPTAPTDRVVFSKPTGESLSTSQPAASPQATDGAVAAPPPSADAAPPAPVAGSPGAPADAPLTTESTSVPAAPSSTPVTPDAGTLSVPPTSAPAAGGRSAAPTQLAASPSPGGTDASPAVAALAVAAALGGAALWAYAGRREVSPP